MNKMRNLLCGLRFFIIIFGTCLVANSQEINSFTLINAQTDTEIKTLTDNEIVYVQDVGTNQFSIRANVSEGIGSIVFALNDTVVQIENNAPYAMLGNSGANYASWTPELGTYSVSGSVYDLPNGEGSLLGIYSLTIVFSDEVQIVVEPSLEVPSLILINADTDEDIGEITDGSVFAFSEIGTSNLNIRAETSEATESIVFGYQAVTNYRTENLPVYAIGGNNDDDYRPWVPDLGANTVSATAYELDGGNGAFGNTLTVDFEIVDEVDTTDLPIVLRINSGGETVAIDDVTFAADDFFSGDGKSFANTAITDIQKTDQDVIYTTERSTNENSGSFSYNVPLTDGLYEIRLHFAEVYWGATGGGSGGEGKRVFNVAIEGAEVLTDFDMNAEEEPMTAIIKTFPVNVVDGEVNIVFDASVDQPKVAAIEIFGEGEVIPAPEDCSWTQLADSFLSKVEAQNVKVNNKLYVFAGFLSNLKITPTTEIYDSETNIWSTGAPMPTAVTHMGAVGVGDEIWILGGFVGNHPGIATNETQIYNTVTDTWSVGPSLPDPRGSGAAVYSEGKIHFFGGLLPDRVTDVGEHYILDVNDIASGWKAAAPLPNPRNHLSGAAVNGKIYAIGGQYGHDKGVEDQKFLDEYDPITDIWTRKADLPSARSHFEPGTLVHNEKIIIVGGRRGSFFFNDVTEYDPASDSWAERCELPVNLLAPSAKVFGDRLIVANGGENGTCCPKSSTISIPIEPEIGVQKEISVLVYHETSGFRHVSIASGIAMMAEFGNELGWTVDSSQTSDVFNTENLEQYDVVVWLNTSGDGLLEPLEQSAFENFIQNGGGFVGIHAATDTYRDGSWSWYNDLVGGIVQIAPNHTLNDTNATMTIVGEHPAVSHLDDTWNKDGEYYYWERNGGYLFEGNIDLLQVETTGANSYDAPRPITWYKNFDGGRSFYTALGHNDSNYETDVNFRTMIKEAILWAAEEDQDQPLQPSAKRNDSGEVFQNQVVLYPNPAKERLFIDEETLSNTVGEISIYTIDGSLVAKKTVSLSDNQIRVDDLPKGYYLVSFKDGTKDARRLVFIE